MGWDGAVAAGAAQVKRSLSNADSSGRHGLLSPVNSQPLPPLRRARRHTTSLAARDRRRPAPDAFNSPAHVRILSSLLLDGPGDRPRHRQHADLRARQGHRARRALGRRHPPRRRPQRQEDHPGGRHRSQGDARQGARQHRGDPADEGRRHRRLHRHRADAQAVHQDGPSAVRPEAEPAHHHLRALRLDPGRAPRHPRVGARRRRLARST